MRKNKVPPLVVSQVTGLTVIALLGMAVFLFSLATYERRPELMALRAKNDITPGPIAVQLITGATNKGVHFISSRITVQEFLSQQGIVVTVNDVPVDRTLEPGMRISLTPEEKVVIGEMDAAMKLALDIPLDINEASYEDLVLIPGIGEKTAASIIAFRREKGGCIKMLDELLTIPGIKERRLKELKRYLTCKICYGSSRP